MHMARAKSLFHSANHAINFLARSAAKKAVTEQLRAQGVRVTLVKPADIVAQAKVYLEQHPELYQLALERARRMGYVEQILVTPDPCAERNS
jgi:NAD(P)-dependent dehydrogenase (short-subunit alcohol dehydrogenase family)